jgi:hypothetical protein
MGNGKFGEDCCQQCGSPRDQFTKQCSRCLEVKREWYYRKNCPGVLEEMRTTT